MDTSHDHGARPFAHRALVYDDREQVTRHLADTVSADLRDDHAVLLCVDRPMASSIRELVGPDARLHVFDVEDRYTRPVDALHVMWRFTRDQTARRARRVHSIGELRFDGGITDDDWHWYEAACSAVLQDLPLTATCLYDAERCPQRALAMVRASHDVVELGDARLPSSSTAPPTRLGASTLPERPPDLRVDGLTSGRAIRQRLRGSDRIGPEVVERAMIVLSELVANAVRHGGGEASVELWFEGAAVLALVSDLGVGIDDPFVTMRPPVSGAPAFGLWLANLAATRLVVDRRWPRGTRATALVAPV